MSTYPSGGGAWVPSQDQAPTGAWDFSGAPSVTFPGGGNSNQIVGTVTASPAGQTNQLLSKMTAGVTPLTAVSGLNAIRGEFDLPSGDTISGTSYFAGVHGRANINGTVNIGSGDLAAVYGKFDLNGSTLTSGHIAPVQSNIVNPPSSAVSGGVSLFYGESASGTPIANGIELYMGAAYLLKLTQVSGGSYFVVAAVGGSQSAKLKINVGGTDYFIPLNTA